MILVTGGAGYIGSHTVKCLMESGYECVVVDNLEYGHREAVLTPYFEQIDIRDKRALTTVFQKYKIDAVMHFAGYIAVGESVENPEKYYENNVGGTLTLLSVMRQFNVNKIIFSSTCATYGEPQYTPIDESHPQNPINPYGTSKWMIEKILADYHKAYGLNYIALRYFNASGAAQNGQIGESHQPETHLIPLVLEATQSGKKMTLFGTDYPTRDGTCIRDYIYIEDLAMAHKLALEHVDSFSGAINLGTGIGTTVKELITTAERVTGAPCPVTFGDRRAGDSPALYAVNTLAKTVLNWQPQTTELDTIIKTAWNWAKNKRY